MKVRRVPAVRTRHLPIGQNDRGIIIQFDVIIFLFHSAILLGFPVARRLQRIVPGVDRACHHARQPFDLRWEAILSRRA